MGLSEDPFRAGLCLLTFLSGFDLFFGALEPSLVVAGLIGSASFLIARAVTFLAVSHADFLIQPNQFQARLDELRQRDLPEFLKRVHCVSKLIEPEPGLGQPDST